MYTNSILLIHPFVTFLTQIVCMWIYEGPLHLPRCIVFIVRQTSQFDSPFLTMAFSGFHSFVIRNHAQVVSCALCGSLHGWHLEVEMLGCKGYTHFHFISLCDELLSKVIISLYTYSITSKMRVPLTHILTNTWFCDLLTFASLRGVKMGHLPRGLICISLITSEKEQHLLPIHVSSWVNDLFISAPLSFSLWVACVLFQIIGIIL